MLGWKISIHRQTDEGALPASAQSPGGTQVAVWLAGLGGLAWLDELVKAGSAIDLGGNGYPCRYTATAQYLIPRIVDQPPGAFHSWTSAPSDSIFENWYERSAIDHAAAAACRPDEWLLVEAWDES